MAIPMARVRKYVELQRKKDQLQAELRKVNQQQAAEAEVLIDRMTNDEVQSVNANGMTLYISTIRSAVLRDGKTVDDAKGALESLGYGDVIKPYSQSVSALFREWESEEDIPAALSEVYQLTEIPRLGHRNG